MMHRAWSSIEEVPYSFSRSYIKLQGHADLKIIDFSPNWAFPDCNSSLESSVAAKWCTKLEVALKRFPIVFSCDQAALQMVFSVCPSVCLSVCLSVRQLRSNSPKTSVRHTSLTMFPSSYHHEIFRNYYQWQKWRPCKRSRSEVKGQGQRGHDPTLPFPDCNSSLNSRMMMKWCI